jgi:periplasmic divalent cation tolerance protein
MAIDCVTVWTTIGTGADGQHFARTLVAERLAACVNVMGEMESVYRWQDRVETARERQVIIKTTMQRIPALQARVQQLHEYDVPEFIVMPIVGGSDAYLEWVRESTAG